MNCVLITSHLMLGVDLHDTIPPPGPVPVPVVPHFVGATLSWLMPMPTNKKADKVEALGWCVMQQGTDIGNFIPHCSAWHYLWPLVWALSGSKSHFGVSTVQVGGSPVAVAMMGVYNYNLNCGGATSPPTPTGLVIAPNTVISDMTLGDIVGGVLSMIIDAAIQYGLNRAFASNTATRLFGRLQGPLIRALVPNAPRFLGPVTALLAQSNRVLSNPYVATTLGNLIPSLIGVGLGSPLGYCPSFAPIGWAAGKASDGARALGERTGDRISDALTGGSHTEQFPSSTL